MYFRCADLATADALQIAREVDSEGERTIGVLTKLDLMDKGTLSTEVVTAICPFPLSKRVFAMISWNNFAIKGTDARRILNNEHISLLHGYTAVVNRSQRHIQQNASISSAFEAEQQFFRFGIHFCTL